MKDNKVIRILAGLCFLALAVLIYYTDSDLQYVVTSKYRSYSSLFQGDILPALARYAAPYAGFLIIAVGLFANQPGISVVGSVILALQQFYILNISYNGDGYIFAFGFLSCVLLILTLLIRSGSVITGLLSGVTCVISLIMVVINEYRGRYLIIWTNTRTTYQISSLLWPILMTAPFVLGAIMTGIAYNKGSKPKTSAAITAPGRSSVSDSIGQLTKLKEMLDKGYITQAEFDEKKKQLSSSPSVSVNRQLADRSDETMTEGGWKCAKCGKTHYAYESSCSCGASRFDTTPEETETPTESNTKTTEGEAEETEIPSKSNSRFDEVRQYKNLLDEGIITQEEFDAKKKQLLNM